MTNKEAKEAIKEAYGNTEYADEIIKALEPRWVPVDEGLPEVKELDMKCDFIGLWKCSDTVLVSLKDRERPSLGFYMLKQDKFLTFVDLVSGKEDTSNVAAWMSMPVSYKEEEE